MTKKQKENIIETTEKLAQIESDFYDRASKLYRERPQHIRSYLDAIRDLKRYKIYKDLIMARTEVLIAHREAGITSTSEIQVMKVD